MKYLGWVLLISLLFGEIHEGNAAGGSNTTPSLQDLWENKASLVPYKKIIFTGTSVGEHEGATSSIIVHDGKWYSLNRVTKPAIPGCQTPQMVMGIRQSSDLGQSWGALKLVTGDEQRYCGLADGDMFYDKDTRTWFVLTQCLSKQSVWDLCLYTKSGRNPMTGDYVASTNNPVVSGGSLWRRICTLPDSGCLSRIYDEGTPKIVRKKSGYYFVTFHGYDGANGYRGMAKTTDFRNWVVSADDLPNGIVFSSQNCKSNSPECIGGGHDSVLADEGYHYHLIETPNGNLACKAGQEWPVSLFRSKKLNAKSSEIEPFRKNPLIRNSLRGPIGCELTYAHLFKDANNQIYLYVSYFSDKPGIEWYPSAIFRLEFDSSGRQQIIFDRATISTLDQLPSRVDNSNIALP